jgi:hypothetical protein
VQRGHFSEGTKLIALSDDGAINMEGAGKFDRVATHELGHGMEWVVPDLFDAEEAFLWSRTSSGEVGSRVREKPQGMYGGTREVTRPDEFPEKYTGKHYEGQRFREVFTTGIESLMAGSRYLDTDMRQWLVGTLALL